MGAHRGQGFLPCLPTYQHRRVFGTSEYRSAVRACPACALCRALCAAAVGRGRARRGSAGPVGLRATRRPPGWATSAEARPSRPGVSVMPPPVEAESGDEAIDRRGTCRACRRRSAGPSSPGSAWAGPAAASRLIAPARRTSVRRDLRLPSRPCVVRNVPSTRVADNRRICIIQIADRRGRAWCEAAPEAWEPGLGWRPCAIPGGAGTDAAVTDCAGKIPCAQEGLSRAASRRVWNRSVATLHRRRAPTARPSRREDLRRKYN